MNTFFSSNGTTSDESEAKKHLEQGNVDLALIAYKRIQPVSARILNIIGRLSAERKWDYDYAFQCHCQALQMQEQVFFSQQTVGESNWRFDISTGWP